MKKSKSSMKALTLTLSIFGLMSLISCGGGNDNNSKDNSSTSTETSQSSSTTSTTESSYNDKVTISIKETEATCLVGGQTTLHAVVRGTANKNVLWSSDNSSVATVDTNGTVTGLKIGEANITAAAEDNPTKTATLKVTVQEATKLESIAIVQGTEFDAFIGDGFTIEIQTTPAENTVDTVTWMVEDESVLTIDENNVINPIKIGTTKITATSVVDSTIKAEATVHVREHFFNKEASSVFNYDHQDDAENPYLTALINMKQGYGCTEVNYSGLKYEFSIDVKFEDSYYVPQPDSCVWTWGGIGNGTSAADETNIFAIAPNDNGIYDTDGDGVPDDGIGVSKKLINIEIGSESWGWGKEAQYIGVEFDPKGVNRLTTIRDNDDFYYALNGKILGKMRDEYAALFKGIATKPLVSAAQANVTYSNYALQRDSISSEWQKKIDDLKYEMDMSKNYAFASSSPLYWDTRNINGDTGAGTLDCVITSDLNESSQFAYAKYAKNNYSGTKWYIEGKFTGVTSTNPTDAWGGLGVGQVDANGNSMMFAISSTTGEHRNRPFAFGKKDWFNKMYQGDANTELWDVGSDYTLGMARNGDKYYFYINGQLAYSVDNVCEFVGAAEATSPAFVTRFAKGSVSNISILTESADVDAKIAELAPSVADTFVAGSSAWSTENYNSRDNTGYLDCSFPTEQNEANQFAYVKYAKDNYSGTKWYIEGKVTDLVSTNPTDAWGGIGVGQINSAGNSMMVSLSASSTEHRNRPFALGNKDWFGQMYQADSNTSVCDVTNEYTIALARNGAHYSFFLNGTLVYDGDNLISFAAADEATTPTFVTRFANGKISNTKVLTDSSAVDSQLASLQQKVEDSFVSPRSDSWTHEAGSDSINCVITSEISEETQFAYTKYAKDGYSGTKWFIEGKVSNLGNIKSDYWDGIGVGQINAAGQSMMFGVATNEGRSQPFCLGNKDWFSKMYQGTIDTSVCDLSTQTEFTIGMARNGKDYYFYINGQLVYQCENIIEFAAADEATTPTFCTRFDTGTISNIRVLTDSEVDSIINR